MPAMQPRLEEPPLPIEDAVDDLLGRGIDIRLPRPRVPGWLSLDDGVDAVDPTIHEGHEDPVGLFSKDLADSSPRSQTRRPDRHQEAGARGLDCHLARTFSDKHPRRRSRTRSGRSYSVVRAGLDIFGSTG